MSAESPVKMDRDALPFHPCVQHWFAGAFQRPTPAQLQAWKPISEGKHTLLLAPTGSGKTLAAFLVAIDRIMFAAEVERQAPGVRVLYLSPLKALGVDVQRNLRAPLAGITAIAQREEIDFHPPTVGVRSGDTPAAERYRTAKQPPEILITTPESLFLILTSRAREILDTFDTVIVDEIHSLVRTKRGSHLFLSLERLEQRRKDTRDSPGNLQRIGLSATQRPLEEVARLLGGAEVSGGGQRRAARAVEVVEAGRRKTMHVKVEVPVEDMANLAHNATQSGPAAAGPTIPSIWPSIHPRLVELISQHRSTMIFVNSRRLAERMAAAINDLAEKEIALAHHGSIAKDTRLVIEDRLKRGTLPAIVATSSLELGIDMGAVDLVIQIEAPPSIAAGIQRIGRAGHHVNTPSHGVIFPKYRGDLLACSAAVRRMLSGEVEESYYPRNPLDVLAQQIVAMAALEPVPADQIYKIVRSAAPFGDLTRNLFDGVLDLLSGRYPSDEFAELRPRVNWDRVAGIVSPRRGTQRIAIANAGTIPDRGLYGVFLATGDERSSSRVGELDEEMVFECLPGDVFLLGASSWRVLDITHDRVLVEPAPGEPGRMPFWRGDGPGRPLEFGKAIGKLTRELIAMPRDEAQQQLASEHGLDVSATQNLLNYLHDQVAATGEPPTDRAIIVESFLDEVGDWRIVLMSPFGSRVHAPWATAVLARLRAEQAGDVDMVVNDDGIVFRLSESDQPPEIGLFFPSAEEVEEIVVRELGSTAMFAARFRENAARALLLPRRYPGKRTPLWLQRRKSADLLAVASRYERFPIMLETYRECLRDVFDLRGLKDVLRQISRRKIRVHALQTKSPSPFAASLMFTYTANFLYHGDAPLAERRAATLALDHVQLRELLGDAQLRELLDAEVIDELTLELQRCHQRFALRDADSVHDLLRFVGDLSVDELQRWPSVPEFALDMSLAELLSARRVVEVTVAGQRRLIAAEDAGRYQDALGCVVPPGLPDAFLEPADDPLGQLISRFARTHVPFVADEVAARFGLGIAPVEATLRGLSAHDRVLEGEFLPGGRGREWCDVEVLRKIKRRSLAKLRSQVEPVEPARFARFLSRWQGLDHKRRGLDGVLDVMEQLQGLPLPFSEWESAILPARIHDYQRGQLDELCTAGELIWRGFGALGARDGRVAFYLADAAELLAPPAEAITDELEQEIYDFLAGQGASFFDSLAQSIGGFKNDLLTALWRLVWSGNVTNDTTAPLRSLLGNASRRKQSGTRSRRTAFRSRRSQRQVGAEGRWTTWPLTADQPSTTRRQTATAMQLIERYGVLTRECVAAEGIVGGFAGLYPILKAMEAAGRVRRGYFVTGQGAAQFAAAGADDQVREADDDCEEICQVLAATDPANPYGAVLRWPLADDSSVRPQRTAGAQVMLAGGALLGYLTRGSNRLITFLPEEEPMRSQATGQLLDALSELGAATTLLIKEVDGIPVEQSTLASELVTHGFVPYASGYQHRAADQQGILGRPRRPR